ncbi:hypothetical protein QVD17_18026 [Tagetes erecta]|uniref:Uncharacterized protein n=1 Tax=Tagetes erecta TaxID=13708 RepID=A0AAD8KNC9_TARER|nr:hypothetical protein QVD17_18026 [Tagetes erecta]
MYSLTVMKLNGSTLRHPLSTVAICYVRKACDGFILCNGSNWVGVMWECVSGKEVLMQTRTHAGEGENHPDMFESAEKEGGSGNNSRMNEREVSMVGCKLCNKRTDSLKKHHLIFLKENLTRDVVYSFYANCKVIVSEIECK